MKQDEVQEQISAACGLFAGLAHINNGKLMMSFENTNEEVGKVVTTIMVHQEVVEDKQDLVWKPDNKIIT